MMASAYSHFSFVLLALLAIPAQAAPKLKVHMDRVLQPDYLGVNEVYHGFAFMPENEARGMNDADRSREFARVSEMRSEHRADMVPPGLDRRRVVDRAGLGIAEDARLL